MRYETERKKELEMALRRLHAWEEEYITQKHGFKSALHHVVALNVQIYEILNNK